MRIAIITTSYAQSNNDWSVPPLIEFVRSLAANVEVDVYTLYYPLDHRRYRVFGTQIFSYNLGQKPRLLRGLHKARMRNDFTQEHAARPYDLIHAVWADTPAALAAQLSARLNIPMITTVYAGEAVHIPEISYGGLRSHRAQAALTKVLTQSATITCGSQGLADQISQSQNYRAHVIPFGLSPQRFSPAPAKMSLAGEIKIITAASFNAVKGLPLLQSAFRTLVETHPALAEGVHWHVMGPDAGNSALRDALIQQIGSLPITLHTGRPHWEMPDFYRAGDIAVHGSWFESQCFAAMEPAACGVPVAGTAVGVIPEMVSPHWTCAPGSAEKLTDVLVHVLSNRADWADEAARQRAWVLENATLTRAASRFIELYQAVAGKA